VKKDLFKLDIRKSFGPAFEAYNWQYPWYHIVFTIRRLLIGAFIAGIAPIGALIATMIVTLGYALLALFTQPFLDPIGRNTELVTGMEGAFHICLSFLKSLCALCQVCLILYFGDSSLAL